VDRCKTLAIKTLLDWVFTCPRLKARSLTVANRSRSKKVVDVFESLMELLHWCCSPIDKEKDVIFEDDEDGMI
jgi:hypothetical protein